MHYVDTSVLVSIVTPDDLSEAAVTWVDGRKPGTLHISEWVTVEMAAALTRKVRTGRLTGPERHMAFERYTELSRRSLLDLPLSGKHLRAARELVVDATAGIRAGDALHLAIASANDLQLVTADKQFFSGATRLGYAVELLA